MGKSLSDSGDGTYNFDIQSPPTNPLTGEPVASHYRPRQNFKNVFKWRMNIVERCRSILLSQ